MALTLVGVGSGGTADAYRGIPSAEVGINCESFKAEYTPAVRDKLMGITGEPFSFAVSAIPSCKLTISGEVLKVSASGGALAATWVAAFVPVNVTSAFGRSAGGFYLTQGTMDLGRSDWFKTSVDFESDPLLA